ncbi:MAG: sodium:proton antiporter NhaD [Cytophagaceae bacterium]
MATLLVVLFIVGYTAIVFEHVINLNKTATALLTGVLCWTVMTLGTPSTEFMMLEHVKAFFDGQSGDFHELYSAFTKHELSHHLSSIAEILFFLLGAMTIVELMDAHGAFRVITDKITTTNRVKLLWIIAILAFVLAAILDSLATAIIMITLLRKLVTDTEQRMFYAGLVVIAANAGGAFSPIGNVTTTMLWIGGQISISEIMLWLIIPSIVCLLVPLIYITYTMKDRDVPLKIVTEPKEHNDETPQQRMVMFIAGVGVLLFVPIFKAVTHLPPYMGMLLALGIVWVVSEMTNKHKDEALKAPYTVGHALSKIDTTSILFFMGILLSISALESMHLLSSLAHWLSSQIASLDIIVFIIGIASAVIDNVPLVAASMGMYSLEQFPMDDKLWHLMAYCAGTGGSILIIGSAAGVAVMGMEKISFGWYMKRIALLALLGYVAGTLVYLGLYSLLAA